MAEAHPVGFRWAMKARERGATIIHVDPRFSRTSAMADLHVPIRAGTDIAFLGGLISHVLETETYFKEYVARLHERLDAHQRGLPGHRGPRRLLQRLRPRGRGVRPGARGCTRAARSPAAAGQREHSTQSFEAKTGAGMMTGDVERDPTLQHPRCVLNVLKRHFARYTPEMVERICGISQSSSTQVAEPADRELRPRAHVRAVLRASAGRSTPPARR